MKRTITVLLVACVLIFSSLTVASASMSDIIAPMADNYRSVYADLKITSGEATVSAKMNGKIGITTKVPCPLYLHQFTDVKWVHYDAWQKTEKVVNCTLSETVSVPKGYTYRAKASCYAYAGSKSEHVIKYSAEVKY